MTRKNVSAWRRTLRPQSALTALTVGVPLLLVFALFVMWQANNSAGSAGDPNITSLAGIGPSFTTPSLQRTQDTNATNASAEKSTSSLPALAAATLFDAEEQQDESIDDSASILQSAADSSGASMSNHVSMNSDADDSAWRKGSYRWQIDTRMTTLITAGDQRMLSDRVGGEYLLEFPGVESEDAAHSLLASAANATDVVTRGRLLSNRNTVDDQDTSFSDVPELLLSVRGVPETRFELPQVDPLNDLLPRTDDNPFPTGDDADDTNGTGDQGLQNDPAGGDLADRGSDGPQGAGNIGPQVPEPLTMPVLLVGWLLLFRARRSRLDLARLQQLLEESASFKLPSGSSDRTLAQLTLASRNVPNKINNN